MAIMPVQRLPWIVALVLAIFWGETGDARAQIPRRFDPAQFDCSSGPGTSPWPLHMVTFVAQEAHYCAWDLDKLSFTSVGQPIVVTQKVDNFVIFQDVTWNPLTRCGWKCHAPFAIVADPRHPLSPGQRIGEGLFRLAGMAGFSESDGGAIQIAVVELVRPDGT